MTSSKSTRLDTDGNQMTKTFWTPDVPEKQESLLRSMKAAIVKRQFLLKLKAKYAGTQYYMCYKLTQVRFIIRTLHCVLDGQKIAKRLSSSINKETNTAKKLLHEYNVASSVVNDVHVAFSTNDILSLDSNFWQPTMSSSSKLPWGTQKEITSAYLLIKRTGEELSLLRKEVQRVLVTASNRKN